MKLKLGNIQIFKEGCEFLFSKGDSYLIKIESEDGNLLENVIREFRNTNEIDKIYYKLRSKIENREQFDQIVNTLLNYGILNPIDTKNTNTKTERIISIVGKIENTESFIKEFKKIVVFADVNYDIKNVINPFEKKAKTKVDSIPEIDMLLVFSPLINDLELFLSISRIAYENSVPIFHCSIEENGFTVGPIVHPKDFSPCLTCFINRKISSLDNPDEYLTSSILRNISAINNYDITKNKYKEMCLLVVRDEMEAFWKSGYSSLISKSVSFNMLTYNATKEKILKLHSCDVCNKPQKYLPFNT